MSNKKELNALKEEVKNVNEKPHELNDEELEQDSGGINSKSNHKGDVITFKLNVPVTDEVDVVE